ncbi:MAG: pyrroline-5-carboxylate reductase [Ruminococcaceae bacterium]|nr:pyrroline-5-carboxylate reductase [Oscillospiraceae bacterium]
MNHKIAFFGAGNMGGAVIEAIVSKKVAKPSDVIIFDKYLPAAEKFAEKFGTVVAKSIADAAESADVWVIAVKPNVVPSLLKELKKHVDSRKIIVSIAAGVKVSTFVSLLGEDIKLVRTIPNMPAMVGEGLTGIYFFNMENDEFIVKIFDSCGKSIVVSKENMIDEMIPVTSSSPAYVCMMVEAMADAAVKAGFQRKDAYVMAEQAILGTAKLMLERNIHPAVLKDQICSPGGTTIEAVISLEKTGFRSSLELAMEACSDKVKALDKGASK